MPAHFCGICGLKPTPGRVPSTGHFPPGAGLLSWLGVVGPMARTIADLRALFEVIAGPDPGDAHSVPIPKKPAEKGDKKKLKGLRVGLPESSALPKATPETQAAVTRAAKFLEGAGMIVEPLKITGLDRALDNWWFFFGPVVAHLFRPTIAGHENELSPIFREYMAFAAPEKPLTLDEVLDARAQRDLIRQDVLHQLRDVPILLSAVSSKPAFRHGEGTYRLGAR